MVAAHGDATLRTLPIRARHVVALTELPEEALLLHSLPVGVPRDRFHIAVLLRACGEDPAREVRELARTDNGITLELQYRYAVVGPDERLLDQPGAVPVYVGNLLFPRQRR